MIAGRYLTLTDDGYVAQDYFYTDTARYGAVRFRLTLEEAKRRIENFNGTIKNHPRFFAFVRVYKDEPEYYGFLQRLRLTEFAEKHRITYADKFKCVGGRRFEVVSQYVEQSNFLPKKYVLIKVPMTAIWISLFLKNRLFYERVF